jgi:uncharacterized membrane protein/protein-disulfide isomerase
MTSRLRTLILGLALVGFGFAAAAAWVHYRLLTDPGYISPCDINATFNCTQAYLSRFGSIGGVPVALGGMMWFALVALIAAFSRPSERAPGAAGSYIFALATVGLAAVLYLGYASFFILKTACLLCMGTYVSVIGIFLVSGLAGSEPMTHLPSRLFGDLRAITTRPTLLVTAVLFLTGAASAVAFFPREMTAPAQASASALPAGFESQFAAAWAQQPRVDLGIPADGATVLVVKFNDYLCPSCKAYEIAYQPILDKYAASNPGAVRLIVKDWPWSADCNSAIRQSIHGHESSCVAAASVRMAKDRGKGSQMVAWLFSNQDRLVELNLTGADGAAPIKAEAERLLGVTDFDRQYLAKLPEIQRDVAEGAKLQVHSTPTFYVNGVLTSTDQGNLRPDVFDLAIKIELEKAGKE